MNDRSGQIGRRDALRMAMSVGAGLALRPRDLRAHEGRWDELQAASLVTKPIPSTGERLPVIGIGTAPAYGDAEPVVGNLVAQAGNRSQPFLATRETGPR